MKELDTKQRQLTIKTKKKRHMLKYSIERASVTSEQERNKQRQKDRKTERKKERKKQIDNWTKCVNDLIAFACE